MARIMQLTVICMQQVNFCLSLIGSAYSVAMCKSIHSPDNERHRSGRYRNWCYVCELLREIVRPAGSEPRKLADDQLARIVHIALEP